MEKQQTDIIIANGMVVSSSIEQKAVVIKAGKVLSTPENAAAYDADRVIDAKGKFVLPGIITPIFTRSMLTELIRCPKPRLPVGSRP